MTRLSHAAARLALAQQRQMTSLMEKEIIAETPDMVFTKADWVPLYYDRGHKVTSDCGTIWAFRALTLKGQFLWFVLTKDKTHGYHATATDPIAAIEMAKRAWDHRRAVRQDWHKVESTARDLILGRQRFDVRIEDLFNSPLCHIGFEGFRQAVGLGRVKRIPGRLAAILMQIEPQLGFLIHAAWQRHEGARASMPPSGEATPAG